jgi:mannose-6-phosphate isomerase-like protein (cupin superfamily)
MIKNLPVSAARDEVFKTVETFLENKGFSIASKDETRPWGGFYVIDEDQSKKFVDFFFKDTAKAHDSLQHKISPKILIVEGGKRLSWQYHNRRSEIWKIISGEVGVITSDSDKEGELVEKRLDDVVILAGGERHRLVGLNSWGIIAEIWQHTVPGHPSDEEDIIRVQDDFGREEKN